MLLKVALRHLALALLVLSATTSAFAGAGGVDTSFNVTANNSVNCILTQPSGKIIIGGAFSQVSGFQRGALARLFPDGNLDNSFSNSINSGGTIFAMLMQPDGKLLVAGNFSTSGQSFPGRQNVARLNVDGSVDGTFTNSAPSSSVFALGLQTDGKVLIGGQFTFVGSSNHFYIARLNSDGTVDHPFNPGSISGGMVNAIAVQTNGAILIGGSFNNFNFYNLSRNNIARLGTDGTPDLNYQASASSTVQAIYLQPDGMSVWAGTFSTLDTSSRSHVGRLKSDGTVDAGFTVTQGVNNTIFAVTEDANKNVYVGGIFSVYNNSTREGIARVFSDGTLDNSFNNTTTFPTPQIKCVAIQSDGKILAGGTFTTFNSSPRTNLIRLFGDTYPAEITTQPQGRNVAVGSNVIFSVEVSNPTAVSYQWRKDGQDIPGASFSQYSLFNVQTGDTGNYSVLVGTAAGGITSSNALLQVGIAPVITLQPTNFTVLKGQTAFFTAAASGTPLNYYWKFGGNVVGTNTTLTLTNVAFNQAGSYTFIASNFLGSATSTPALLTVIGPITAVSNPGDQAVPIGGTANFSVTATGGPLNYQWLKDGNPITNANSAQFSITNVALTDAGGYSVIVSNQFNSVTSLVAQLTVGFPPVVTLQPVTVTNNLGDTVVFNCTVTGDAPITFQWLFNGNPITNQTGTNLTFTNLTLTNVQIANIGNYALAASNPFGSTTSSNAFLNLNGYPSNLYFGLVAWYPFNGNANDATGNNNHGTNNGAVLTTDRLGNTNSAYFFNGTSNYIGLPASTNVFGSEDFTIAMWFNPQTYPDPANPSQAAGFLISKGQNNFELSTGSATSGTGMHFLPRVASGNDWNTPDSVYQTNVWQQVVAMYQPSAQTVEVFVNGVSLALTGPNNLPIGSDNTMFAQLGLRTDGTLGFNGAIDEVRIYNRALSSNDVQQLYAAESGAPTIQQPPQSQMLFVGDTANFSVQATGVGTLSYQWYYSNAPVAGATNFMLTLPGVQSTNAGPYYVVVSNNFGSTPSTVANLAVGNTPQTLKFSLTPGKLLSLQMPGTPGFNYLLQTATNLTPPVLWQTISTLSADSNGLCTYVDTNPPASSTRYYRISTH